jgi:glycogen operon protein
LLLFDREDDCRPARVIPLDPARNHTYHYWHVFAPGVQPDQIYGYRVHGLWDPANGLRFDASKVLLDPYGHSVVIPKNYNRNAVRLNENNASSAMKSVVVDTQSYNWERDAVFEWARDARPKRPCARTISYELHVRGFTRHPALGARTICAGRLPV